MSMLTFFPRWGRSLYYAHDQGKLAGTTIVERGTRGDFRRLALGRYKEQYT